jgi:hypothetical protein
VTTRSGDEHVNVLNDPSGKFTMDLEAASGDVTVDYS